LAVDVNAQNGLKDVMRVFPQGVTVVTTMSHDGPYGITVSAFTSISLTPPLVMISVSKQSSVYAPLLESKQFAVNLLADDQKSVSDRFAGRHDVSDRFEGIGYSPGTTGSPIIKGARAFVECRTWKVHDGGDHSLLLGEVIRAQKLNDKPPLVFYGQLYTTTERVEYTAPQPETRW
jgi:flavin reductase (DIM6/NTAB) family NADH-FMN oxidoreductase RutF